VTEWEAPLNQRMFVAALAKMVSPMQVADAVNAMLPMLAALKHLPDSVFERPGDLAAQIGVDMDRVPSLAKLRRSLDIWCKANQPKMPAANEGLGATGLTMSEQSWVVSWRTSTSDRQSNLLSTIRNHSPRAFEWIVRDDLTAADIAVRHGWGDAAANTTIADQVRADWQDREIVRQKVILVTQPTLDVNSLRLLGGLVAKWAPENLDLVPLPEDVRASLSLERAEQRTPTPAQHAEMRSDEGIVVPKTPTPAPIVADRQPGTMKPEDVAAMREAHNPGLVLALARSKPSPVFLAANDHTMPVRPAMPWDDEP
jgi:hypothetical protein